MPSLAEVTGSVSVTSVTWVNETDGESGEEKAILEEIISNETKNDDRIDEPNQDTTHIINADFIDIDINIITSQDNVSSKTANTDGN